MQLDDLPGFRRRFIIAPAVDRVRADLEDDYHCMGVTVHHDGRVATGLEAVMARAPWNTCPGAVETLRETFTGVALEAFAERGAKRANCTHLHDLATLAARHAFEPGPLVYDILVSDPVEGARRAEIRRNGASILEWTHADGRMTAPAAIAGMPLDRLKAWIDSLEPERKEAARLLQWGTLIANGRTIPWERQTDARRMRAGSCFTFQPDRMTEAKRIGAVRDFSTGPRPLEDYRPAP